MGLQTALSMPERNVGSAKGATGNTVEVRPVGAQEQSPDLDQLRSCLDNL